MNDEIVHVLVCVNKKATGKCCAMYDSEKTFDHLKAELNKKRTLFTVNYRVKAVKTSCLGQCGFGPHIFIPLDNLWYTFSSLKDVDELIVTRFIHGEIPHHLINTNIHPGELHDPT